MTAERDIMVAAVFIFIIREFIRIKQDTIYIRHNDSNSVSVAVLEWQREDRPGGEFTHNMAEPKKRRVSKRSTESDRNYVDTTDRA